MRSRGLVHVIEVIKSIQAAVSCLRPLHTDSVAVAFAPTLDDQQQVFDVDAAGVINVRQLISEQVMECIQIITVHITIAIQIKTIGFSAWCFDAWNNCGIRIRVGSHTKVC